MSIQRVPFTSMRRVYDSYQGNTTPCRNPAIRNQCAVRMSLALGRNGFTFESFGHQNRIHHGRASCGLGEEPHLVGANELHLFLVNVWDAGMRGSGSEIQSRIQGLPGIVYFNNCFHRGTDEVGTNTGDHIDLWDGSRIYNEVLRVTVDGDHLFNRASFVRFFRLG